MVIKMTGQEREVVVRVLRELLGYAANPEVNDITKNQISWVAPIKSELTKQGLLSTFDHTIFCQVYDQEIWAIFKKLTGEMNLRIEKSRGVIWVYPVEK
jgi:hypothetical protein